jgi:hypothetical protein
MIKVLEVCAMGFRAFISNEEKSSAEKTVRLLGLSLFVIWLAVGGSISCKKKAAAPEAAAQEKKGFEIKEGLNDFEGVVKVAFGKYLYIPAVQGFDVIVQGQIESGDTSMLVGKEVRGKGVFTPDKPSLLVADSIEVKEGAKGWKTVFTRSGEAVLDDYINLRARDEFQTLNDVAYDKSESWEGKCKVKVFGKLVQETVTEGGQQKEVTKIIILDKENKGVGNVIVDRMTDFAQYYLKKMRLFDNLWFYMTIKDTVAWKTRRVTNDLFHADVLYCGLF